MAGAVIRDAMGWPHIVCSLCERTDPFEDKGETYVSPLGWLAGETNEDGKIEKAYCPMCWHKDEAAEWH